jgi:DNA-binding MarR family transcriptional regulator
VSSADLLELFRDLVRLETALWNNVDARVQGAHGLPLAWVEVMHVISTTPGCRVLDISKTLSITVGGASKVVDKVEAAGWCRRMANPGDGRSSLIELTRAGKSVLEAGNLTSSSALAAYMGAAAKASELASLSATLRKLRQHLDAPNPVRPGRTSASSDVVHGAPR